MHAVRGNGPLSEDHRDNKHSNRDRGGRPHGESKFGLPRFGGASSGMVVTAVWHAHCVHTAGSVHLAKATYARARAHLLPELEALGLLGLLLEGDRDLGERVRLLLQILELVPALEPAGRGSGSKVEALEVIARAVALTAMAPSVAAHICPLCVLTPSKSLSTP